MKSKQLRDYTVADFMSKNVLTVAADSRVSKAVETMVYNDIGSVVVTKDERPQGIFIERDLLNKVLYTGTSLNTVVGDVSTLPLVMAQLGINGCEVVVAMVSRRIKRLPLTQKGEIVGIVTARDIVEAYASLPDEKEEMIAKQIKVRYGELCPIYNSRIDDHGLCGCGAGGE